MPCILLSSWLLKLVLWFVNAPFFIAWLRTQTITFINCFWLPSLYVFVLFQRHSLVTWTFSKVFPFIYIYNSFPMVKRAIQCMRLRQCAVWKNQMYATLPIQAGRLFPQFDPLTSRLHGITYCCIKAHHQFCQRVSKVILYPSTLTNWNFSYDYLLDRNQVLLNKLVPSTRIVITNWKHEQTGP